MQSSISPLVCSQHTLSAPVSFAGIGLHTGTVVQMQLHPAPANSGVYFVRTDVPKNKQIIKADLSSVIATRRGTALGNDHGVQISTVEHLLSALLAHNIDNVRIEIDGAEIPAMDGCSKRFSDNLLTVGTLDQERPRKFIRVLKPVTVKSGQSHAQLSPCSRFEIDLGIEYQNPAIGKSSYCFDVTATGFAQEIAPARTFVLRSEIRDLQQSGKGAGGTLDNCIVVAEDKIENAGGLRFADEFVRHKVLDAIGDISLIGGFLLGKYRVRRAGHQINYLAVKALRNDPQAWEAVTADQL